MSQEYIDHVMKFVPTLRSYGLDRAANYLECWLDGNLDLVPPLDISALLDSIRLFGVNVAPFAPLVFVQRAT